MANRNRKLQVFVSSTFIDLQEERQAAVQAILKVGHIPAGMELFKAGDEEQWEIIKNWIEESDVYMLILGGRYGSIEPKSGKSYTQLEYEYALELGKPFFAIVINDTWTDRKAKRKGVKIEDFKEVNNLQKLNEFRATVKTKMVSFADDLKDIKLAVSDSLHEINKREHLQGWVKSDDTDFSSISEELARLSKENSELKDKLSAINTDEKVNGIDIRKFAEYLSSQQTTLYTKRVRNIKIELFYSNFFKTINDIDFSIEPNFYDQFNSDASKFIQKYKIEIEKIVLENIKDVKEKFDSYLNHFYRLFGTDCDNFLQLFYILSKMPSLKINNYQLDNDIKDIGKYNVIKEFIYNRHGEIERIYLN